MIYKSQLEECSYVEAEACISDKIIALHFQQGHVEGGDVEYSHVLNIILTEYKCQELIDVLNVTLRELKLINI